MLIASIFLIAFFALFITSFPDKNLHFIACDVGQGDALLVTLGTTQILIDGGPDKKVLSCLSRHTPFWDRKIDIVIVTNPDLDHYGGLVDVIRNYEIGTFARPDKEGEADGWRTLLTELNRKKIKQVFIKSGQSIRYSTLHFDILHPPGDLIAQATNQFSVVGNLSFGEFDVLLTGDIIPDQIPSFLNQVKLVEVLKVPHHGSKNGLTQDLLVKSSPKLAVISLGKNNRFGHPHKEVLDMLSQNNVKVLRTDQDGEIEVVSDGEKWWIK